MPVDHLGRRHVFSMPVEQTPAAQVEGMILVDAEIYRRERKQLEELRMKVSELSGKVDTLISLATSYKSAADSSNAASMPPDDPEVEALGHRIDDAIAVLQGSKSVTTPPPVVSPVEPTPVPPPVNPVLAPQDPNAPVT